MSSRSFSAAHDFKRCWRALSANVIRFSEAFPDAGALLAECARFGLVGMVAKRKDAPYRSDARSGWIKVKTPEWKAANQYRARLFAKE